MEKSEVILHSHSDIQELIRFIDQKAGALLIIYGFILTATIEVSKDLKFVNPFLLDQFSDTFLSILLLVVGFILLTSLIIQIHFTLFSIIKPRKAKNYTQDEVSVLYFGHTSKRKKNDFVNNFTEISIEDIEKQMLEQIYEISCILSEKSENFNSILKYLYGTIFCLLLFIYLTGTV
ncbi:Pycsar system effector family protein [Lysinibacillus capsici]|uniref:Pycsar system effector family protein n=1 Tax=Lysinibacillus capsici TaxID=2115968 RepID=UPI003CFEFA3F